MRNKAITKCIVLFTLIISMLAGVLSFTSCNRSYDEEEVLSCCRELLPRAEMLNDVYYGKGIAYNTLSGMQNGAYFDADVTHLKSLGFETIAELKEITEKTFTQDYSIQIYESILSPLNVDGVNLGLARYYQRYEGDSEFNAPLCIMVYSKFTPLYKDTVVFDYSSLRVEGSKGQIVTVCVDASIINDEGESRDTVIDIQLIEEKDGWRINNHTWANYNSFSDRLEELEKEELK